MAVLLLKYFEEAASLLSLGPLLLLPRRSQSACIASAAVASSGEAHPGGTEVPAAAASFSRQKPCIHAVSVKQQAQARTPPAKAIVALDSSQWPLAAGSCNTSSSTVSRSSSIHSGAAAGAPAPAAPAPAAAAPAIAAELPPVGRGTPCASVAEGTRAAHRGGLCAAVAAAAAAVTVVATAAAVGKQQQTGIAPRGGVVVESSRPLQSTDITKLIPYKPPLPPFWMWWVAAAFTCAGLLFTGKFIMYTLRVPRRDRSVLQELLHAAAAALLLGFAVSFVLICCGVYF